MTRFALLSAAALLIAGSASAQTTTTTSAMSTAQPKMPAHAIAAHKTGPDTAQATTTPTETPNGKTKVSKTVVKGGAVSRSAASMDCSKQADAQNLHGAARKKMRTACMAAARKS